MTRPSMEAFIRTTSPTLDPIGWVRGRPVFPILGGAPDGADGDGGDSGTGGAPAGDPAANMPAGDPAPNSDGDSTDDDGDKLEAKFGKEAAAEIRRLRTENGRDRTAGKEAAAKEAAATASEQARAELLDSLKPSLVKLGVLKADEDTSPEQLRAALGSAQDTARQTTLELEVYKTAAEHGGTPNLLLDSRTFLDTIGKLDPTASDFRAKVVAASKKAVEQNPTLKAARAAGKGGAEFSGGSGEQATRSKTAKSLEDSVRGTLGG